jgi:hypothetical protein
MKTFGLLGAHLSAYYAWITFLLCLKVLEYNKVGLVTVL